MDERKIQKDYVMNYLCRREDEGGLGYRNVAPNIVENGMFIPSVLTEFISTSQAEEWKRLLRKYDNNEKALEDALVEAIREKVVDKQNVAIFFNTFKTFTFGGEQLTLFYVPGTELRGDDDFNKNIFCAVEEASYKQKYKGVEITSFRPDVTFYLNGIFFGYMELKCVSMGQNAKEHGRGKVAKDYLSAIRAIVNQEQTDSKTAKEKKALLAMYEKAIHITASDINETYVMRNMAQMYDMAHAEFAINASTSTVDKLVPEINKVFKPYPISSPLLTEKQKFEEVARALYSKQAVKNEILYYNFIEYKYVKKDGKRTRTTNSGRLISPRPKQKFGCDKIMGRIKEMLDNEGNPDFYTEKLRKELYALGIPTQKTEEIIAKREKYCNNKFVYSLLMQYAAGFGKSNIIGWTALQLKDYRYDGAYAYDKIMLVVDRQQLRDQLDERMFNMNIDKSMFVEATDKKTFIEALDDQRRIIVVNIQKFLDLQAAIDEAGKKLKNMRVAFLIDEIHRSNSGENNKEMINLFERLQDSFNNGEQKIVKKNLLIGFTATPSDETLSRFGEWPAEKKPKQFSLERILEILSRLNEQELIKAREAQRWLTEIGVMFDSFRQKEKLCVILRDDKTPDEEKLKEYKKFQNIYKLVELKKRTELAKVDVFKKMLDDNVEQFFSIFMNQLKHVDNGDSDFDYDTTDGEENTSENLSMEDLIEIVRKKIRPDYNEEKLKAFMCKAYAPRFEKIAGIVPPMNEIVDNLFKVLDTPSLENLDGIGALVKDSLHMLCMAEHLTLNEKRMHLNQLLIKYEAFLKKLYYLVNHKELEGKEPGTDATLSSAIFGIPSLKKLKYSGNSEMMAFSNRLDILRQLRNDEAHGSSTATEQEIDVAVGIVVDMYLYAAGTNPILAAKRYVFPTDESTGYQVDHGQELPMAAEP